MNLNILKKKLNIKTFLTNSHIYIQFITDLDDLTLKLHGVQTVYKIVHYKLKLSKLEMFL